MHSQSSEIKKIANVESQAKLSIVNNMTLKIANNQIGTMTKRKQNTPSVHQSRSTYVNNQNDSPTIDVTVVNVLQQQTVAPTISNSPSKHLTQSKSQQLTNVHHMASVSRPARLTERNGRRDITDDQNYLSYPAYPNHGPYTHNSTAILSMSSPHIANQHNVYNNQYLHYPMQVQQSQPQSSRSDIGNRQYSNRQNNSNNPNKKGWNYSKSKRTGNNNSTSSDKSYNSSNDNNNNNKTNNEYTIINKPTRHVNQQVSRNNNKSYHCETSKNISPVRDPYSSSSSCSSSSSVPMAKKSIHQPHSPVIPQLISSISFQGDSRTTTTSYPYERESDQTTFYVNAPWPIDDQFTTYESSNDGYSQIARMYEGQPYNHSQQFQYMNVSTGYVTSYVEGRSNQQRISKSNRPNRKNGVITANGNTLFTPPDRYMNQSPYIEVKETPDALTNGSKWDRLSKKVWEKFMAGQQRETTYIRKIRMWKYMYTHVMKSYPNYSLYVVGSTMSGFGSDTSDVDMCLVDCSKSNAQFMGNELRIISATILKHFENILKTETIYADFNLITAKVPILRFRDTIYDCEIDLNYNNYVGVQNTQLLYCYGRMDWRLRPLVLVVKLWARFHGINNAKEMTISSYSLVLMVIHFLQCGVTPAVLPCLHEMYPNKFPSNFQRNPQEIKNIDMNEVLNPYFSNNKQTLGELFLKFFSYYTNFDFANKAISVRLGAAIPIESCKQNQSLKNDPNQWKELCIEEPFDFTNTAHSCYDPYKFHWIQRVFQLSFNQLQTTNDFDSIFDQPFMPLMP